MSPEQKSEFKKAFRQAAEKAVQGYKGSPASRLAPLNLVDAVDKETTMGVRVLEIASEYMQRTGVSAKTVANDFFKVPPPPKTF